MTTATHAGTRCPRCSGSMFSERVLDNTGHEYVCLSCSYTVVPNIGLTALLELAEELEGTQHQIALNRRPYRGKVPR